MKNIQIIDGALNTSYSVYAVPNDVFELLFPEADQDIEFLEDAIARLGMNRTTELMKSTWNSRVSKSEIYGIHGTLFIDFLNRKVLYPNKRESDLDDPKIQGKITVVTRKGKSVLHLRR